MLLIDRLAQKIYVDYCWWIRIVTYCNRKSPYLYCISLPHTNDHRESKWPKLEANNLYKFILKCEWSFTSNLTFYHVVELMFTHKDILVLVIFYKIYAYI